MKVLFLITLFANISVFLWHYFGHDTSATTPAQLSNPDPKQILLVSEVTAIHSTALNQAKPTEPSVSNQPNIENNAPILVNAPETSAIQAPHTLFPAADSTYLLPELSSQLSKEPAPLEQDTAITNLFCYEIGPFVYKRAIQKWENQHSTITILNRQVITKMARDSGKYMVYFPAAETYELSLQNLKLLKAQGINDLWFFKDGEDQGNISLAMVKDYQSAQALQQKFQQKGLATLIKKHLRERPVPMLFLQITLSQPWPDAIPEHSEVTIQTVSECQFKSE